MRRLTYKHYLLALLTLVAVFNYLDRFVLALLLEPIKQDLQLSDSQLGLLTGFAFALFYSVAGIPIARWADTGNRNTIVSVTTGLWSCMVALCGMATSFVQLLLIRIGVAVGEAGCLPPAQSWISDYFDRAERPAAMAFYGMCFPVAVIVGYLGGGFLSEHIGWRMTFVAMGLPGIALALLVRFTLPEPRLVNTLDKAPEVPSLRTVFDRLRKQKTFPHIAMAFVLGYLFGNGIYVWLPAFLMRSHGMDVSEVGLWLAFANGVCGVVGTILGGLFAIRYAKKKEALQMRLAGILFAISSALYIFTYLTTNKFVAIACLSVLTLLSTSTTGMVLSAVQSLMAERMRSIALAIIFLLANLIGGGFGPLLAGVLSDFFATRFAEESLRYALLALSPGYFWVAYHYWKAGDTIEADIQRIESFENTTQKKGLTPLPEESVTASPVHAQGH